MRVAVRSLKSAYYSKTFTAVLTDDQGAVGLEQSVWIFWIDNKIREVKGAPYHPLTLVALLPRHPAVIGNEQGALRRFYKSVNALRIGRRDRHRNTTIRFLREPAVGLARDLGPGVAAVRGTEQPTA